MIITISGLAGSGKSTVAKLLAKKLGFKHYSTGDFMRQIAQERGITLLELGYLAEKDKGAIDRELDARQKELGEKENNFVIDARLGFLFIPKSFKIFLEADSEMRARRIFTDKSRKENNMTFDEALKKIEEREKSNKQRYKEYYNIDFPDKSVFDLVVDTDKIPVEEVVEKILAQIKNKNL